MNNKLNSGFTLIELLIVVAIIGVLSAIGIPQYRGYVDNSKTSVVKNNLRAIYTAQQDYYQKNNIYYKTGNSCTDSASLINTNLFNGQNILTTDKFIYCVTQTTTDDFTAKAQEISGSRSFTITNQNVANF